MTFTINEVWVTEVNEVGAAGVLMTDAASVVIEYALLSAPLV